MHDIFPKRWEVKQKFIKKRGGSWKGGLRHDFQPLPDTRLSWVKTKINQNGEIKNWDSSGVLLLGLHLNMNIMLNSQSSVTKKYIPKNSKICEWSHYKKLWKIVNGNTITFCINGRNEISPLLNKWCSICFDC